MSCQIERLNFKTLIPSCSSCIRQSTGRRTHLLWLLMSEETQCSDVTGDSNLSHVDQNIDTLKTAVRHLPSDAVNELLSIGVCVRCVGRLFGIGELVRSCSSLIPSSVFPGETAVDNKVVCNGAGTNEFGCTNGEFAICSICLGILQFTYHDEKDALVKKSSADDFCSVIAQLVKNEGHTIDDFSLEVSVPPVVSENEQAVWMYMKKKYGDEQWAQENLPACTSVKEALKVSIADSLKKFLGVKSGNSSFRIRLTFMQNKSSRTSQNTSEKNRGIKRTKQGAENGPYTVDKPVHSDVGDHDVRNVETDVKVESSYKISEEVKSINLILSMVREPCCLELTCCKTHIYFGGRYLKYSRNVSQTRWIIDDERMGEASVEEIIGGSILPLCHGDNFKFHAAGREDIDVRMLGSGRPFLVEIQNPRHVPSDVFVKEIESKINHSENKLVQVKNLKLVDSQGWDMMREGEAEKQKQYAALVWISQPLEDIDVQTLTAVKELQVSQKTPIRVLHRRSPMERGKIIHWMNIERIAGASQYFLLHLCTQAGTYIKEFVHGDLGRTNPSVGSILGCRAEILQLDVTDVKMDCFLGD